MARSDDEGDEDDGDEDDEDDEGDEGDEDDEDDEEDDNDDEDNKGFLVADPGSPARSCCGGFLLVSTSSFIVLILVSVSLVFSMFRSVISFSPLVSFSLSLSLWRLFL